MGVHVCAGGEGVVSSELVRSSLVNSKEYVAMERCFGYQRKAIKFKNRKDLMRTYYKMYLISEEIVKYT